MKKALILGITGQDGSYLAEFLLAHQYEVHGIIRRSSSFNTQRIDSIYPSLHLYYGDLCDSGNLDRLLLQIQPDEVYQLGAQSHVKVSFDLPGYTTETIALGTLKVLEAIRGSGIQTRFYHASSSEMFGKVLEVPQTEKTPFYPRSPYACAKVFAHQLTVNYREAYGLHASNGILFNHESPRRGETFVTRKITRGLARILAGKQKVLELGNLEAKRDWGYAPDYVEAMWQMLQQEKPDDYIICTGETHSVREFVQKAFDLVGLNYENYIVLNSKYHRPTEVDLLIGDASKAKKQLGWKPRCTFPELIKKMVSSDLALEGLSL